MQSSALISNPSIVESHLSPAHAAGVVSVAPGAYQAYQIIRRNGAVVSFEPSKIAVALMKAFLAVHGAQGAAHLQLTLRSVPTASFSGHVRHAPAGRQLGDFLVGVHPLHGQQRAAKEEPDALQRIL